ncbi:choline/carnitine O-acyltransferase [Pseudonocardia saturnea]
MPTFGEEDRLPRVPLPTLQDTTDRFLAWCTPLLTPEELATTEAAVADLLAPGSPAHALHADLVAYDGQPGVASWLDEFWRDRYLGRRDRIALNANFFFLFEDSELGQTERAAHFIAAAVAYKLSIDDETLPVAEQRGKPLSMQQNRYLFSATRIPGDPRDSSRTPYTDEWPGPSQERHIVVLHRGAQVALDVIDPDGRPYTADEIAAGLRAVLAEEPGDGVGALTSKARAEWAASRAALLDAGNGDTLDVLERALFCVALEDSTPADPLAASDALLHGDSANRWFDKSVSLIVFADGTAGFNGEHCNLDGTTIIAFLDAILEAEPHGGGGSAVPATRRLEFALDDALRADIAAARADFAAFAASTATVTLSVDFDAERAKALKCSPDAFAQLAYQLAHQRAKGHIGATYESIATRSFRHGRTEAMRVVTPEVLAFVAAMDDPDLDTRREAFRAAADAHVTRAKECQAGLAPEQHLWELQLRQQRQGGGEPMALFDSPGWTVMRDDYLSTSAVPSPHIRYWGFGSTSEKCIGIGYAMLPDRFDLYLSTPRTVADRMAVFAHELPVAVRELEELLDGGQRNAHQ